MLRFFLCCVVSWAYGQNIAPSDELVVTYAHAPLKVGEKSIAAVRQGTVLKVKQVHYDENNKAQWYWVDIQEFSGWLWHRHVAPKGTPYRIVVEQPTSSGERYFRRRTEDRSDSSLPFTQPREFLFPEERYFRPRMEERPGRGTSILFPEEMDRSFFP